jgi:hypothetical protein
MKLITSLAIVALLLTVAPLARSAPSVDDDAKFLAGLPVHDPALAALTRTLGWEQHSNLLGAKWYQMETRQMAAVRGWAAGNLGSFHGTTGAVYYMFSGPDILYAHSFFPNASPYILCGTEPVGAVPDPTKIPGPALSADLANLRHSMETMLTTHYFITKDMRVDLQRGQIGGTLPILYVFLARSGCTLRNVVVSPSNVQIDFTGPSGRKQTLFYFKTDLSNGAGNGAFLSFCHRNGPGVSLLKSASYLLQGEGFSTVRNFLLANSRLILEDDSGIPLKAFDPKRWTLRYFGSYNGPIDLFKGNGQPALAAAYAHSNAPSPGFSFGYAWQKEKAVVILATPH